MGYIVIQVDDNGSGMDLQSGAKKNQSKGILLIRKKIASYYSSYKSKRKAGIKIRSKKNLNNGETGVLVSIFLPLQME